MPSHTDAFFEELGERGSDPALRSRTATIRFEITDADRVESWSVAIDKGDIVVSSPAQPGADCILRADHELFERILSGETDALAAMLRGELAADGDPELLIATRRLVSTSNAGGQA